MKTLRRSIGKPEVGGEPLPPAFAAFERAGIILRRAEITMIAGAPGAGKSSIVGDIISGMGLKVLNIDDHFIKNLDTENFLSLLPDMRICFSYFSPSEIDQISGKVSSIYNKNDTITQKFIKFTRFFI